MMPSSQENLIKELKEFDVPCYLVRNKAAHAPISRV